MNNNSVNMISEFHDLPFPGLWYEIGDESHFWMKWRFYFFIRNYSTVFLSKPSAKIVDVGGGTGILATQIQKEYNCECDILDLDLQALSRNKNLHGENFYYNILDKKIEFYKKYDIVLLFDVLEHVPDRTKFIEALSYLIKDDGILILNVPARPELYSKYDYYIGHLKRYTKKSLAHEFNESNFELIKVSYWGLLLTPIALLRKIYFYFRGNDKESIIRDGFKPPSKIINKILIIIAKIEIKILKNQLVGTSLMAAFKKNNN